MHGFPRRKAKRDWTAKHASALDRVTISTRHAVGPAHLDTRSKEDRDEENYFRIRFHPGLAISIGNRDGPNRPRSAERKPRYGRRSPFRRGQQPFRDLIVFQDRKST